MAGYKKPSMAEAWSKALCYALRWGLPIEDAEDVAQNHVIANYILGNNQMMGQSLIDYLRSTYGDTRAKSFKNRRKEGLDHLRYYIKNTNESRSPEQYVILKELLEQNIERLNLRELSLIKNLLTHKSRKTVEKKMRMSSSQVSQMIKKIMGKIKT